MKKIWICVTVCCVILPLSVFIVSPAFTYETEQLQLIPTIEIITRDTNRSITITQNQNLHISQFLVLAVGYGTLRNELSNNDTTNLGDLLFITGVGISAAGILPVFNFGVTNVTLRENIKIGTESSPYGVAWIGILINSSQIDFSKDYRLGLSFNN